MKYVYFPGCTQTATANPYQASIDAVVKALGLEFQELEDWNCCGATAALNVDVTLSLVLSGRNLAHAQKQGGNLVTPCSGCYAVLRKTNDYFHEFPDVREKVQETLAAGNLNYDGSVKVRHLLDVLINDVGLEAIGKAVTHPLKGIKVASYYGCQLTRPAGGFDDPEVPETLDNLVKALGAEPVPFPMAAQCCGAMLAATHPELAYGLIRRIFASAHAGGAQCIITACPLCQNNLEFFQGDVNAMFGTNFKTPIVYFTQLMGLAMGISPHELGLDRALVPTESLVHATVAGGQNG